MPRGIDTTRRRTLSRSGRSVGVIPRGVPRASFGNRPLGGLPLSRPRGIIARGSFNNQLAARAMEERRAFAQQEERARAEQEARHIADEEIAQRDQVAIEQRKMQKERSRILSLYRKERTFYQQNRIEIESLQKEIETVMQSKRLGISQTTVKRIATNIDYMFRTTEGMDKLNSAQKVELVRNIALTMGMQIAENPAVRVALKRDPTTVNNMVREAFTQQTQQQ